jgi:hypothetical protein
MRVCSPGGYGLVVKRVLAKDQSGVRFSLSAQIHSFFLGFLSDTPIPALLVM